jgi:N-sulfoglucosamine sulfohydrolase
MTVHMRLHVKLFLFILLLAICSCAGKKKQSEEPEEEVYVADNRPNILLAIADDMSWLHTSYIGYKSVRTPSIDWLAKNGVWFNNAYCSAPSCSASRASLLTGRNGFELKEGACLWSIFPAEFKTYTEYLETSGYFTGYTGKGWGPGNWKDSGRDKNPAGEEYNDITKIPFEQLGENVPISKIDYAENFREFLNDKPEGKPFCFWYGANEPHRDYLKGIGQAMGKKVEDVEVPEFLPDVPEVRNDILDYLVEVEWFDLHLGRMIDILRDAGELENTIIIVTSDNGMLFPRAGANLYDYGTHMPLVIYFRKMIPGGRQIDDLVSQTDLAPTILEIAGLPVPQEMSGKSLVEILNSNVSGIIDPARNRVFTFRERHAWVQPSGQIYPMRAIRKDNFLLIWNPKYDMYPAGHPDPQYNFNAYPFGDVDNSPTKDFILSVRDSKGLSWYYDICFGKREEFELYNLTDDPYQLKNLARFRDFNETKNKLTKELKEYLQERGDLRMKGEENIYFEAPYYTQKSIQK